MSFSQLLGTLTQISRSQGHEALANSAELDGLSNKLRDVLNKNHWTKKKYERGPGTTKKKCDTRNAKVGTKCGLVLRTRLLVGNSWWLHNRRQSCHCKLTRRSITIGQKSLLAKMRCAWWNVWFQGPRLQWGFSRKRMKQNEAKNSYLQTKKHVIMKYEDLAYPSPASRCSSVAPAVRKALAQPKVQT